MYIHMAAGSSFRWTQSSRGWLLMLRLTLCRCVATRGSCGHMWQVSPLTGVRVNSRHLNRCGGLGWCYAHAQPHMTVLAAGVDPGAQDGGTSWSSSGESGE